MGRDGPDVRAPRHAAINSLTSMMERRMMGGDGMGGAYSRHVQQATNDALLIDDDPGNNHEEARN